MWISHKRLTIWNKTFAVLLPIYGHKCRKKVIENWTSRLDYIRASRGSPMPEIIFKMTATAGSDVVQSGRPIFDDFFQHLWPYIGNNTKKVVFQIVKRLWLIRIDQSLYIAPQKIVYRC
ncbi:hypothetical protein TNCV_2016251 [Trichonephila clavipes]|nr:hypothetical protein TNCV_2016251 [Trichonephila clavipes]